MAHEQVDAFGFNNYETIVYGKAALFHYHMSELLGEEAYLALLRDYAARYRFQVATPDDFLELIEAAGGQDALDVYTEWILGAKE